MALINCFECGREISDQATACPHCGAPRAAKEAGKPKPTPTEIFQGSLGLVFLVFLGWLFFWPSDNTVKQESAQAEKKCKADDLQCLGDQGIVGAGIYCKKAIESLAEHSVKWTDGTFEMKFSKFRWKNKPAGVITFIGDKAEFQNGFGAFTPVIYECDMMADNKSIVDARVTEGRLP